MSGVSTWTRERGNACLNRLGSHVAALCRWLSVMRERIALETSLHLRKRCSTRVRLAPAYPQRPARLCATGGWHRHRCQAVARSLESRCPEARGIEASAQCTSQATESVRRCGAGFGRSAGANRLMRLHGSKLLMPSGCRGQQL